MEHFAPYRAGCLGIFMRKRIKTPRGITAVNSNNSLPIFRNCRRLIVAISGKMRYYRTDLLTIYDRKDFQCSYKLKTYFLTVRVFIFSANSHFLQEYLSFVHTGPTCCLWMQAPMKKCAMIFPCTSTNTADSPTAVTLPYEIPYGEPPTRFFLYYPT